MCEQKDLGFIINEFTKPDAYSRVKADAVKYKSDDKQTISDPEEGEIETLVTNLSDDDDDPRELVPV